ncbi:hypothetical protein COCON_G00151730 [Conger conger]|uniref:Uncharacterized protein n=1 Tax=Conger conger TaxID=82655 RepID=A0A9Q1D8G0_CONCO|nr:hypothetical protein COCON_G00151730 [Conger conger]
MAGVYFCGNCIKLTHSGLISPFIVRRIHLTANGICYGGVWGWLKPEWIQCAGQGTAGREPGPESGRLSDYARITAGFTDEPPADGGWLDAGSRTVPEQD